MKDDAFSTDVTLNTIPGPPIITIDRQGVQYISPTSDEIPPIIIATPRNDDILQQRRQQDEEAEEALRRIKEEEEFEAERRKERERRVVGLDNDDLNPRRGVV